MTDRLAGMTREEKLALLQKLAAEKAAKKAAEPVFYTPSFAQRRLFFLHQLDPESQAHSMFRPFVLRGALDREALTAAARDLVRRHDALRTGFLAGEDGEPRARVAPPAAADRFEVGHHVVDFPGDGGAEGASEADRLGHAGVVAVEEGRKPFAIDGDFLWRLAVLELGEDDEGRELNALLFVFHHIVCDGWSLGVIYRELSKLYAARVGAGKDAAELSELPELPIRYSDFARWQSDELDTEKQLEHWLGEIGDAPTVVELPTDHPRPAVASLRGALASVEVDPATVAGVRALASDTGRGTTSFMAILALLGVVIHRYSGQSDLLIGTPVANRHRSELEGLVGSFANTLVVRVELGGRPTFRELLERVRRRTLDALDHQDLPFERLVEALQPERDLSRNPLFQVMFSLVEGVAGGGGWSRLGDLDVEPLRMPARGLSKVDLTLELFAENNGFRGYFEYATDLFDEPSVGRLARSLHELARAVIDDPDQPVDAYPILDAEAEKQLVVGWNTVEYRGSTDVRPDISKPLHQLIADVAAERGDAIAVETVPAMLADGSITQDTTKTERTLTYAELVARSRRLARHLRGLGAHAGERVGVCLERSAEAVVAFLAVLESGAAYVPLDPTYPRERLEFMLGDSKIGILLTQGSLVDDLPEVAETLLLDQRFDELTGESAGPSEALPDPLPDCDEDPASAGPGDPAYVIYTSGSTGQPKGVLVPHRAVVNHGQAIIDRYRLGPEDRALQFASLSFDIAVEEIFPTWLAGATLVIRDERQSLAFADFFAMLEARSVSVANLPTPYWHEWVSELAEGRAHVPESLRLLVVGTEQALPERLQAWLATVGDAPAWINAYGPSEATVTATAWSAPPAVDEAGNPAVVRHAPVGLPIAGVTAHVLDASLRPVPVGVIGELYLGGAGLALGYLDRPRLTAEAFVPDPFGAEPGARLYSTGDRARRLDDGAIEFLGRLDQQVKIRGFRIEVGEIEAALAEHPGVREAVILALAPGASPGDTEEAGGEKRLAAYVATEPGATLTAQVLHEHVAERLPGYMVPAAFVILDALPMTASGKVDRRALPAPEWASEEAAQTAPRTPQEEILVEIWSEVLGVATVGIHDDFFRLGGHSLLATRMLSRVDAALGVTLPLDAIFTAPSVAELSARVDSARRAASGQALVPPIEKRSAVSGSTAETAPLSFAQQRMWFLQQLEPESFAYNMPTALDLAGALDVEALSRALEEVVRRHEPLRTTFRSERGQPVAVVASPESVSLDLDIVEVASEEVMVERTRETSNRPFDLAEEAPLRLELLRLAGLDDSEARHRLVFVFHHIASDGWSTDRFVHELVVLYGAFLRDEGSPLRPLPVGYGDYASWQREWIEGDILDEQLAYWKDELAGAPTVLDLPTDRPRPPVRDHRGARVYFDLDADLVEKLRDLGRASGATPYMVYLAAWAALLHRYTHQGDVLVGTPVAGRQRPEVQELIGFFVNTLVIRARFEGEPTFADLLARLRTAVLDAHRHQDLPFERLVEELDVAREMSHNPLFQTSFVLHHGDPGMGSGAGPLDLEISMPSIDNHVARFDLALVLAERRAGFGGFVEYPTDLFDEATVERLVENFRTLLGSLVETPERRVDLQRLVAEGERAELAERWPAASDEFAPAATDTLHGRFVAMAAEHGERVAATCGDESLTYAELDRRSNRLARALVDRGVGPETRVALSVERDLDLVVGILGVLKAGGGYVPVDPTSPAERLRYILGDSASRVLLTRESLLEALADSGTEGEEGDFDSAGADVLTFESLALDSEGEDAPLEPRGGADHLAYVIYTSGSTGRPKGVAITHRNVLRLFDATEAWFQPTPEDAWSLFHSYAFDFSVWEIWGALLYGGRVVVVPYWVGRSAEDFYDLLVAEKVTSLSQTPSMFRLVDQVDEKRAEAAGGTSPLDSLRLVVFGGEALDLHGLRGWWQRHEADAPRLVNMYGITETTVHVTYLALEPELLERPMQSLIGDPIPDLEVRLLDRFSQPVPVGVAGEICVAGDGLARCYHERPSLTAERFVPDPFATVPGARLYRSGDLGRLVPSTGDLDYLGRIDHQVKIRGFRIELGEIESRLAAAEAVRRAVVLAREDEPGNQRLVAYLVPRDTELSDEARAELVRSLRADLGEHLPEYMVPGAFLLLDEMPLTHNGKVDRRALPVPEAEAQVLSSSYEAPRNDTEERLVQIWLDVLGNERVGVHDSFFELGGHSLLATQVMARVAEAFDVDLPLRTLFETPTVAALADAILAREVSQVDDDVLAKLLAELE